MNIKKISLGVLLKQKVKAQRLAQIAAQEEKMRAVARKTAQSVYPYGKFYTTVSNASDNFSASEIASKMQGALEFNSTEWAPWAKHIINSSK